MTCKILIVNLMVITSLSSAFAQKQTKTNLYLYFQSDSSKRIYKLNQKSENTLKNKKIISKGYNRDIYTYSYVSPDGKEERIYKLFSAISNNNYCIRDSSIYKDYKVLPYKNLEKIKGLISEEWNKRNFSYDKVFIIEKIAENQFKVIQVQLYFPFNSHGFLSRPVGSKEIIVIP